LWGRSDVPEQSEIEKGERERIYSRGRKLVPEGGKRAKLFPPSHKGGGGQTILLIKGRKEKKGLRLTSHLFEEGCNLRKGRGRI